MTKKNKYLKSSGRKYTVIYNDFLESNVLNGHEKIVFISLKKFADNTSGVAFPSIRTLSKMTGLCDSTTRKCIHHMEELGVLRIQQRKDPEKGNTSNLYTLYDYEEMWKLDGNKEEVTSLADQLEEAKMIAALKARGYTVTKEKELTSAATDISSTKDLITGNNNTINENQRQDRYSLEDVQELFGYVAAVQQEPTKINLINAAMNIICDMLNSTAKTIRINRQEKPTEVVVGQMQKLTYESILYAINQSCAGKDVKDHIGYLRSCLYNAADQYALAVENEFNKH